MDYSQAKEALKRICQLPDNRKNKEVNKIIYEHPSLINEVLDFEGSTALILATKNNNIEVIKLLLSQENLDINIQNKYGSTALHCASGNGHKDIVEVLLSQDNIDINIQHKYGGTALHVASHYDHKEVVELLLSQDNIDINIQEIDGETALHRASRYGHKDILELLLSKDNIFINKKRRGGETALHLASRNGHKDIVEVLSSQDNIDINARNTCGWTALHLASHYGHRNIVEGLLSKDNADINLQDKDGKLTIKRCYDRCERSSANNSTKRPDEAFSIKFQVEEARDGDEVKERELLTVVEENKSLKLQVQSLEEITNNTRELEKKLQGKEESMKLTVNNLVTRLVAEKEKEYDELRGQIGRMETLLNQMENCKKELERKLEEKEKVLMLKPFPLPPNKQTHVFLTHTWRDDEKGRNNHNRVGRVNQALRERGLVTWFDSERMVGTVRQDMTKALGDACCVLIFITKKYEEKVNSADEADNCYFEFNVAAHDKNLANMRIPIVMEECMLSLESWQDRGRLKAEMGHKIYFDLSSDEGGVLEIQHDKIVERVVELLRERFPVVSFA